tara:strand:+ start:88 stop:267 length:180 start_codon:yes stop_codon:yes gene_type:complete
MYKIKVKKDYEFRGIKYKKGETYEVVRKVRNVLFHADALSTTTEKKSKKKETSKDLDIS